MYFGNARRHQPRLLRVVALAQHDERVAQAGEAEADAALGHGFVVLLRQRPVGGFEHVVQHADGTVDTLCRNRRSRIRPRLAERLLARSASG
jgi:hypothetical protein